jgi:hypothetical protein
LGNIGTTNRQSLTIGNSSTYNTTGNVLINPNGTGNVGIGTTNPLGKLSLTNNNVSTVGLYFRSDDGTINNLDYSSGRIQSGWETGETTYNQSFIKFDRDDGANRSPERGWGSIHRCFSAGHCCQLCH